MLGISSSSTMIINYYYIVMIVFITSSYAYVIESGDLRNSLADQQFGLSLSPSYDRDARATKFPRIGRSPSDMEEIASLYDANLNPIENEEINNENDYRWLEQRSVLFPRIGKRAFHNLHWENNYSNPHRIFDTQGRYHMHPNQPQSMFHFRGKRNLSM